MVRRARPVGISGLGVAACPFTENILGTIPSAPKEMVAATVRTIFAQPNAAATRWQLRDVVGFLEPQFPEAAKLLEDAEPDVTAYAAFPRALWRKIASTNTLERINKEIKRRSNLVRIFPTTRR